MTAGIRVREEKTHIDILVFACSHSDIMVSVFCIQTVLRRDFRKVLTATNKNGLLG